MRARITRIAVATFVTASLLAACSQAGTASAPTVADAWVRAPQAPGLPGAAFMTITGGSTADALLGVTSPISPDVQMHETVMQNDQMGMQQVQRLEVPANGTLELKSGGNHLMLMGITQALKPGDTVELRLKFEKAGEIVVNATVRSAN